MGRIGRVGGLELLSPAGTYESLRAAIAGGADAVYFGVAGAAGLNMRARGAGNFALGDLRRVVGICGEAGVRSYLTVNSVIYDGDMGRMRELIDAARGEGVSAVIVSDAAAMVYGSAVGMEVHLSTQMNIANVEALRFYARYADVAVLARELDIAQVGRICRCVEEEGIIGRGGQALRIEVFCHGAMCMAVSGRCYLSLHETGCSANRGECLQLCRRAYTLKDRESGRELEVAAPYILSPKDLKTIHFMDRLVDAGVRIFKIEGRARSPEYVRVVTECYKEALVACCSGGPTEEQIAEWDARLGSVFNRGFWDGYYLGRATGERSQRYGSDATKRKVYIAKGIKYFGRQGVGEFAMEAASLSVGDEIVIIGPTTGVLFLRADELRVGDKAVARTEKGERFSLKVPGKVRPSDKMYKLTPVLGVI